MFTLLPRPLRRPCRRRVSFSDAIQSVDFQKNLPPALSLGRPSKQSQWTEISHWPAAPPPHDSHRQMESSWAFKAGQARASPWLRGIDELGRVAQETSRHNQWQLVRGKHWWRKQRSRNFNSPWRQDSSGRQKFKELTRGKCYNCLARGHTKIVCRDPPKCWRCK